MTNWPRRIRDYTETGATVSNWVGSIGLNSTDGEESISTRDAGVRFAKGTRLHFEGRVLEVVEDPVESDGVWTLTVQEANES